MCLCRFWCGPPLVILLSGHEDSRCCTDGERVLGLLQAARLQRLAPSAVVRGVLLPHRLDTMLSCVCFGVSITLSSVGCCLVILICSSLVPWMLSIFPRDCLPSALPLGLVSVQAPVHLFFNWIVGEWKSWSVVVSSPLPDVSFSPSMWFFLFSSHLS